MVEDAIGELDRVTAIVAARVAFAKEVTEVRVWSPSVCGSRYPSPRFPSDAM